MVLFFSAYIWVMTSGHEDLLFQQAKSFYKAIVAWFDDADVDFQVKKETKTKKRSRRWD
jgi:hypothetical protein